MMECVNHPGREPAGACVGCGGFFCSECLIRVAGKYVCGECKGRVLKNGTLAGAGPSKSNAPLVIMGIGCGALFFLFVIGLLAAIAIPNFIRARETTRRNRCVNNLRLIDAAKKQWALEHEVPRGTPVRAEDINPYIQRFDLPEDGKGICPAGGTYTIGAVGERPRCSRKRHRLPERGRGTHEEGRNGATARRRSG